MNAAVRLAAVGVLWLAPWLSAQAQALWLDAQGQPNAAAHEAVRWLTQAERDGLRPADYEAARWVRSLEPGQRLPADGAAAWDAALTRAVERYLRELRHGRVPPSQLGARYDSASLPAPELPAQLRAAVQGGRPADALRAATPPWPQYPALRDALVHHQQLADHPAWRTPLPAAARFVTVNVPEFMLRAWEHEAGAVHEAFAMRVIVGKAVGTRTPLFDEDMLRIEFNPYWNIPPSIARGETVPKLRANPGYLAAQGMEFVGPGGQTSSAVTPEMLDAVQAGQWRVRQRPGRLNALGDIKFVLPNSQNIYLHHTPSVSLFSRERRDFSHGCIRIEEPVALAQWVLAGDAAWTEARIRQTMGHPRPVTVALPTPVPVLIVYRTVSVRGGRVHFAPDLYRQDALLERALAQPRHPASGAGTVRGGS